MYNTGLRWSYRLLLFSTRLKVKETETQIAFKKMLHDSDISPKTLLLHLSYMLHIQTIKQYIGDKYGAPSM